MQGLDNGAIIYSTEKYERIREDITMAKEKKVTEITDMEVVFAQWFNDVC